MIEDVKSNKDSFETQSNKLNDKTIDNSVSCPHGRFDAISCMCCKDLKCKNWRRLTMNKPKIEDALTRRMYTDDLESYCEELEKALDETTDQLKKLVDRVRWHNLDNDSADLPEEKDEYLVAVEIFVPYGQASTFFTAYRLCRYENGKFYGVDSVSERVIAWKYRGTLGDDYE